ncbi:unnamed protein product, partial [Ceratitis capitata]
MEEALSACETNENIFNGIKGKHMRSSQQRFYYELNRVSFATFVEQYSVFDQLELIKDRARYYLLQPRQSTIMNGLLSTLLNTM